MRTVFDEWGALVSRIGTNSIRAAATALTTVALLATPVMAQNAGDVGADSRGNVYTYVVRNGVGTWTRGRTITGPTTERTILAERYTPTIWTDPDGCEHWVMDDGFEGFMTPHVTRHGIPVCDRTAGKH